MNIYDMVDTWNAGATTFSAIKMNVTDTASAAASLLLDLQVAASSKFNVGKAGDTTLASAAFLAWSTDLKLFRDGANILAQRNGTNPQEMRIYNTYTDAANNEYFGVSWALNACEFRTRANGAGVVRDLYVGTQGNASLYFKTNGTVYWAVDPSGNFLGWVDNTSDIGASGATRPRTGYFGTSVVAPTFQTPDTTVAALPAAAAGNKGQRRHVTDANATTFASTVAGGGANVVPVFSNGTAWIIG